MPRRAMLTGAVALALAAGTAVAGAAPKRARPDYDGRGNRDAHGGSWALWIPRIALAPLYAVEEYGIRRPLAAVVRAAEQGHWIERTRDLFRLGAHDYLFPTLVYERGLEASVGIDLMLGAAGAAGNTARLRAATGGPHWLEVTARDEYGWDRRRTTLGVEAELRRRPDYLFLGLGPDARAADAARYGRERVAGRVAVSRALRADRESRVTAALGVQHTAFVAGGCCGDPSLDVRIADGTLAAPPGYGHAYATATARADLVLDSRGPRPAPGTGGYLQLHVQPSVELGGERRWLAYGGVAGGALDLDGAQRTVTLELAADAVDPIAGTRGDTVPFDELATLDSDRRPGFVAGWMTGRSAIAAQAAYTWPISPWLDAELRVSAGNAFGARLDGLTAGALRLSGEVGVTTVGARDHGLELAVGLGTEPIDRGADVTSVRIAIRTREVP